jgi:general secretion pathway protein G
LKKGWSAFLEHRAQSSKILGFTLIEIVISIAIIAILSAIAVPNFIAYRERAQFDDTVKEIKEISYIIDIFAMENDRYPADLAEVDLDDRKDHWGNPYVYNRMEYDADGKMEAGFRKDKNLHPLNTDYDLYSTGPDGDTLLPLTAKASQDDIIRANNGGYVGWGSDY